jgi:hypothetical protein
MPASPATSLKCTQCGGELNPDEGQIFLTCPFCAATVYIDKTQVVFHWSLTPTLNAEQAASELRRWMSGSLTVKDLDKKAQVSGQEFQYFPLWFFKWRIPSGEQVDLEPAAATSISELRTLVLPAGDLKPYDSALDTQAVEPSVPYDAARTWLNNNHPGAEVRESALVHIPLYIFKYLYNNKGYTAVVEAATGRVLSNIYPAKPEAPYLTAGLLTAGVYLCLALACLAGGSLGGLGIGLAVLLGLAATPVLFFFAVWIASKV